MNTSREHQTLVSATLTRLLEISKIKSSVPAEKKKNTNLFTTKE